MLPKINRIKKKKDFELIFKKGASFKSPSFILKVLKTSLEYSRFGFVVSQKVSKKAVERNKIRRRLSEIVKKQKIKPGLDLVFISLASAKNKDFLNFKKETEDILIKAKAINV
jgi:ribonuclease P protein component